MAKAPTLKKNIKLGTKYLVLLWICVLSRNMSMRISWISGNMLEKTSTTSEYGSRDCKTDHSKSYENCSIHNFFI